MSFKCYVEINLAFTICVKEQFFPNQGYAYTEFARPNKLKIQTNIVSDNRGKMAEIYFQNTIFGPSVENVETKQNNFYPAVSMKFRTRTHFPDRPNEVSIMMERTHLSENHSSQLLRIYLITKTQSNVYTNQRISIVSDRKQSAAL